MLLQIIILIVLIGMLTIVIVMPFNLSLFVTLGILAFSIGIWAIYGLLQGGKSAIKLASPPDYNQYNYYRNNKDDDGKSGIVTFLAHAKAIIGRLSTKYK